MGKPVIAPDIRSIREIMHHKRDRYLCKTDKISIQKALEEILSYYDSYVKIGRKFREKVLGNYGWENNVRMVIEKIDRLKLVNTKLGK